MKKIYQFNKTFLLSFFAFVVIFLAANSNTNAQGTVVTVPPISGTTTWGGITYNLQTIQSIIIDTIYVNTSGIVGNTVDLEVWYNPSPINGQPLAFTGAPWVNVVVSQTLPAGVDLAPIFIPGGLSVPAGSNWGFYIGDPLFSNSGLRYGSSGAVSSVTDGTVTIEMGTNVGYGWLRNTSSTSNHPRFFAGGVHYNPAVACSGSPMAGSAVAPSNVCANQSFTLSLTGQSLASGLTYQWMSAPSATGPWTNIVGGTTLSYATSQTVDTYYACEVTCTNSSLADTSASVFVQTSPNLPAGTYTIGALGNYPNFTAAVAAMSCGIAGPVTFNVLSGSGPFNEQITIPQIINSSATNTITFNGNGETITYASTSTSDNFIIRLDGGDYITFDSLNVVTQSATNNFAIHLTNDADFNTINNCNIDLTSALTNTATSNAGIVVSGSLTSATTAGASGTNNTFTNNTITGGYYGITINGASSTTESLSNNIIGNTIQDFYFYGTYLRSISRSTIAFNDIHRKNRATVSSFYGLYFLTSGIRNLIEGNQLHDAYTGITGTSTSASYPIYHNGVDATVGDENRVVNNLVYNINNNGSIYALYNLGSDGVYYYHNTISLDDQNATGGLARGFYQTTTASNIEFKNNIITNTRSGGGALYCIYLNATASTVLSDYNVFYTSTAINNIGYLSGNQNTLANWQAATLGDANSVDTDPFYANPPSAQFSPTNAAVDGMADPSVNVLTDIYGATRSAVTPDPGAIEFTPPSCPQPSNLGVANITATSVDLSWIENGTATVWDIEWDTLGFTPTGVPTITGTITNPHNLTGLTQLTDYEFYVRADCGLDSSIWTGPYAFTTGCAAQLSGIYTIGTTGNYLTFTDAVNDMITCGISAPVVFNVLSGSGPYNEQITIPSIVGASATNTITFNGNGETLTSTTVTGSRSLILLDGADHITFDSLNLVTQSITNNFAIQLTNGADSNTINNCTVDLTSAITSTSTTNAGIVISGSLTSATSTTQPTGSYNTITNNRVVGGYYAITLSGTDNNIISNNDFQDFYSYGIYHSTANANTITKNAISRPNRTSVTTFYGIYYTGSGENNLAEANEIFNPAGGNSTSTSAIYPIYHTGVDATVGNENKVINNIIHSINGNGTIYALYNSSSDGVFYYHNTVSLDDANATGGTTRGFYQLTTASGIELKNNIITVTRGGTGVKYCVYFGTTASTITSDNNVYYINAPAGTNNLGYYSAAQATLLAWQTASTQDANSVDVNPIYTNLLANDLTPLNAGIDGIAVNTVGVANDFYGITRAATPDPGAIEFTPPACPQPTALTTTNILSTSADLGWTENGSATVWDIEIDTAGFTPTGVPTITGTTTNPHNINTLLPQTSYDFYVRADCGVDSSAWVGPFTFTTACAAVIAPWTDSVETHTTSLSITTSNCWTATSVSAFNWNIEDNGQTPSAGTGPLGAHSGIKYFYTEASSGATGDEALLMTPFIDITALTNPIVEYYYHMFGDNRGLMGDLFVDVYDGVSWTVVDSLIGEQQTTQASPWLLRNVDISAFSGTIQVRFRGVRLGAQYGDISLDDISVKEAPNCPSPSFLTATNITATSADLSWVENGSATVWDIELGTAGFTPTGVPTIVGTTTNPHNVNTLTANTSYDFYVRADCGVDSSIWIGPFNFTTPCTSVIAPWTENFENAGTIPACWNQGTSNSESWLFANTGGSNHIGNNGTLGGATTSGNYFAWVDDSSPHNTATTLESPFIDVSSLTNPTLKFFLISDNEGFTNVDFSVDVWDGASWNVGYYTHNTNTVNGEWEQITVNLSTLVITGDVQLRFIVDENNGTDFYDDVAIDDVQILEATVCTAQLSLGSDTIICTPGSILLDAGTNYSDYLWSDAGASTTSSILVDSTSFGIGVHTIHVVAIDTINNCVTRDTIVVEMSTCVGIDAAVNNVNMNVYPNPNNGEFTLNINTTDINELTIKVMNTQGKVVYAKNNYSNVTKINEKIDLSDHANGIYFIIITTDKGIVTQKLVIQ